MITTVHNNLEKRIAEFADLSNERNIFTREELAALKIKAALRKHADINTELVDVIVRDSVVTLNGMVNSVSQKEDAESIVFTVLKGVTKVENRLNVNIEYAGADIYEF